MSQTSKKIEELSYFNAIACLLVVFIHVVSYGITNAAPDSLQAAALYFPWRLSAFVVPAFLFSSALKMSLKFDVPCTLSRYGKYIAGRFKAIYLPYAVWDVIYYVAFILIGYASFSPLNFVRTLFWGSLSSPFYYIVIAMQFYLLQPLWSTMVRCFHWYTAIPISLLVSFTFSKLNAILALWGAEFAYVDRLFPTYLVFWVLGIYVGRNYEHFRDVIAESGMGIAVAALFVAAFAFVPYLQYSRGIWLFDMTYFKFFTDILSIMILLWICLKLRSAVAAVRKTLSFISSASFSVYLSHCLFLTLATHYMQINGIYKISAILIVRFLVCYSAPFAVFALGKVLQTIGTKK